MDIKEIGVPLSLPGVTLKKETAGSTEFQKILQEANQSARDTGPVTTGSAAKEVAGGFEIAPVNGVLTVPDLSSVQARGVAAAENTIALLEEYQKALADPDRTLKQIDPLVSSLAERVTFLKNLVNSLPSSDPLRRIVEEIGTLSAVEVEKFNRGDYV